MKLISLWTITTIFIWAKSQLWNDNSILRTLDKCSMGIYLVHHVLIEYSLTFSEVREIMDNNIWLPLVICPTLFVSSLALTLLLKRLPYIKILVG